MWLCFIIFFFFFSSRRRHTRLQGDWSSDVCSSDLTAWHSHPAFTENLFFLHDVGVVLLKKAVNLPAGQYGKLPTQDQLDALPRGSATTFTAVGYGLQQINPVFVVAQRIRMFAEPHLIQINGGKIGRASCR